VVQLGQQVELRQKFSVFLSSDFVFEDFDGALLFGALADGAVDLAEAALPDGLLELVVVGGAVVDHSDEAGNIDFQLAEDAAAVDAVRVYLLPLLGLLLRQVVDLLLEQVQDHAVSSHPRS